jgi:hypothetical protein
LLLQNRRERQQPSPINLDRWLRTEAIGLSRKMTLTHRRAGSALLIFLIKLEDDGMLVILLYIYKVY